MRSRLARLKEIVQQGPADVIIGKKGLTEAVLKEIDRRLKEKGIVKVKALKSAIKVTGLDRRELAKTVAERLNARLLDVRGRTFVLYRPEPQTRKSRSSGGADKKASASVGSAGRRRWLQR
ncbi:YhbY family RNA-binding protein [Hyperthermus butylicus]|uniref:Conserved archaeal protein n=1 Tax=Hyperthermus butylicus (strain DSM 5456 / JCM 9403 / PLM1-5) TaxID=415426 RepID=A2BN52_HYPBU|nr:YhbY family RNA-binding protein [Hyperthermus butylicus]ABM81413.1 conserved archaeal protein [Hyperthermus butylicus DSM 5456]